jgi:hypothetical protein
MKTLNIDLWPLKPGMEFTSMDYSSEAELRIKDPLMNIRKTVVLQNAGNRDENLPQNLSVDSTVLRPDRDKAVLNYLLKCDVNLSESDCIVLQYNSESDNWYKSLRKIARAIRCAETIGSRFKVMKTRKLKTRNSATPLSDIVLIVAKLDSRQLKAWISKNDVFCPTKRELELAQDFWNIKAQVTISFIQSYAMTIFGGHSLGANLQDIPL